MRTENTLSSSVRSNVQKLCFRTENQVIQVAQIIAMCCELPGVLYYICIGVEAVKEFVDGLVIGRTECLFKCQLFGPLDN